MTFAQALAIVQAIAKRYDMPPSTPWVRDAAMAIMAAENNERERCALIAEECRSASGVDVDPMRLTGIAIAIAIRGER